MISHILFQWNHYCSRVRMYSTLQNHCCTCCIFLIQSFDRVVLSSLRLPLKLENFSQIASLMAAVSWWTMKQLVMCLPVCLKMCPPPPPLRGNMKAPLFLIKRSGPLALLQLLQSVCLFVCLSVYLCQSACLQEASCSPAMQGRLKF